MTALLASVADPDEMELARAGGAGIVDLKNPHEGALGAWDEAALREAVARWRGWTGRRPRLSATIGDQPMEPDAVLAAAGRVADAGVPMVKLGVFPGGDPRACFEALKSFAGRADLIAVFFGDREPDFDLLPAIAAAGFRGAMIDTADKAGGGLRKHLDDAALAQFIERAGSLGLLTGLAGSLKLEDVAPLTAIGPDYLGFRGALCDGGRTGRLDPAALRRVSGALTAERRAA